MISQMFLHMCCATLDASPVQFPAVLANTLVSYFTRQEVEPNFGSADFGYVFVIVNVSIVSIIVFYFILFVILQDRKQTT